MKKLLKNAYTCWKTCQTTLRPKKMCDAVVMKDSLLLGYVPDWFATHQKIKIWHNGDEYCNDDEVLEWYKNYEKWKAQNSKTKEELLHIAWHSSRY